MIGHEALFRMDRMHVQFGEVTIEEYQIDD